LAEISFKRNLTSEPSSHGLVQIFTGDGKGKTSAALGNIIRALGHGLRVFIIFFMKGDYPYGERNVLSQLPNVTVASFGQEEFVNPANIKLKQIEQAGEALAAARQAVASGNYDLVILDEINVAVAFKLISVKDVLEIIKNKPRQVELILTGRQADPRLIENADLVTEMVKIKHPYDKGISARKGFEY
jgi:cob(I)alamin adenosyltransferase